MQIWAESGKSALPICNYSQILYQFLTFTQNLKRSLVFEDTRGHVQTKCKACGRETVFNVLEMRRLRRLQLYYSSLNG